MPDWRERQVSVGAGMILLDASKPGHSRRYHSIYVNGREHRFVQRVWALWNGGPGVIEKVYTVKGKISLVDDDLAFTLHCGIVRLEPMTSGGSA